MRTTLHIGLALAAGLLAAGCYESKVPLAASPSGRLDARLFGHWKGEGDAQAADDLLIFRFDGLQGYAEYRASGNDKADRFRFYVVNVGGVPFLNAQGMTLQPGEAPGYYFFRYEFRPDGSLVLRLVSDELIKAPITTTKGIHDFVRKHLKDKRLYVEPTRFTRVAQS